MEKLSESICDIYIKNYEFVSALSKQYGFKYSFFVQPLLSEGNKPLTTEEQGIPHWDSALASLIRVTYGRIKGLTPDYAELHYLGDAFDRQTSQIYIDQVHVSPEGNKLVAHKILDVINRRVQSPQ